MDVRVFELGCARVRAACAPARAELHRGGAADAQERDLDLTGHVPWLACFPLCDFVQSPAGQALLSGHPRVLELGAGVGLPGLLAGRRASELRLTDNQPAIVAQLAASVAENAQLRLVPAAPASSAELLDWGASAPLPHTVREGGYDVVLASDCVYYAGSAQLLVESAARLLAPAGTLLLAHTARWEQTDRALAAALRAAHLHCRLASAAMARSADEGSRAPDAQNGPDDEAPTGGRDGRLMHARSGRTARVYAVRKAERAHAVDGRATLLELVAQLAADGMRASLSPATWADAPADGRERAPAARPQAQPQVQPQPGSALRVDALGPLALSPCDVARLCEALCACTPPAAPVALAALNLRGHGLRASGDAYNTRAATGAGAAEAASGACAWPAAGVREAMTAEPRPGGVCALLALRACATLVSLDLSGNALGGAGRSVLRALPRDGDGAEEASGGGANVSVHAAPRAALGGVCDAIRACATLRALRLASNGLRDDDALELALFLGSGHRTPLVLLDVCGNELSGNGLAPLALAAARAGRCGDEGGAKFASLASSAPPPLALLAGHNRLEQEGAAALGAVLPPFLTNLDLSRQWLGDDGASELGSRGLRTCAHSLRLLDLSHSTTAWGALAALRHLADGSAGGGSALHELRVRGCALRDEGACDLARALRGFGALTTLDVASNGIGWEGAEALADALAAQCSLTQLELSDNPLGSDGVDALADALALALVDDARRARASGAGARAAHGGAHVAPTGECSTAPRFAPFTLGLAGVDCGAEGLHALCSALVRARGEHARRSTAGGGGGCEPGDGEAMLAPPPRAGVCSAPTQPPRLALPLSDARSCARVRIDLQANPLSALDVAAALEALCGCAVDAELDLRYAPMRPTLHDLRPTLHDCVHSPAAQCAQGHSSAGQACATEDAAYSAACARCRTLRDALASRVDPASEQDDACHVHPRATIIVHLAAEHSGLEVSSHRAGY
ncbi:hypothetical protein KFE25_003147 [Diacronema lutheri]|uniref:Calmodulin-lysine N-methyltransferase n=1 Tax=Diacronema lutheri TaxID=2081491 RepID=A0A8J6C7D0_DIALT|nr:hypothetical protein KFE25_003147 [Diacronema lutheri]